MVERISGAVYGPEPHSTHDVIVDEDHATVVRQLEREELVECLLVHRAGPRRERSSSRGIISRIRLSLAAKPNPVLCELSICHKIILIYA